MIRDNKKQAFAKRQEMSGRHQGRYYRMGAILIASKLGKLMRIC
jgi:hypothetical protein